MLHDAEALLMNDLPVLPIYFYTNIVCYKDYVKDAEESSALGFVYFHNAYIPEVIQNIIDRFTTYQ